VKELDALWCPCLPSEVPGVAAGGALESGLVAWICSVLPSVVPLPDQGISLVGQLHAFEPSLKQQVLTDLINARVP
jgi:hypothetical protein